jgi:hypothetical protein
MMNRNRTGFLYTRAWQSRPKRTENACLRYPVPRDENPVKEDGWRILQRFTPHHRWAGLNHETGLPEMQREMEEALGLVYKL